MDILPCMSISDHERSSPFWLQSAARFRTYQIDLLLPICLELFRAILCLSPDCCRWCHFRMMIFNTQSSWLQWWPHVFLSTMSFWKMRSGRVGNACFGNDVLMFDFLVVLDFALISAVVCMFRIFTSFCKDQHFRFDSSLLFRDENRWRRCNKNAACSTLRTLHHVAHRFFDTFSTGALTPRTAATSEGRTCSRSWKAKAKLYRSWKSWMWTMMARSHTRSLWVPRKAMKNNSTIIAI